MIRVVVFCRVKLVLKRVSGEYDFVFTFFVLPCPLVPGLASMTHQMLFLPIRAVKS